MEALHIPLDVREVTARWLTACFRSSGALREGEVASVDVRAAGEGVGLMSRIARLSLVYSPDARPALPTRMVIKLAARSDVNRTMAEAYDLYQTESRFYAELASSIGVRTPRCFVNLFDRDTQDFALVLEDLGSLTSLDQPMPITDAQVALVVRDLARLHSTWWQTTGATPPPWVNRLDGAVWGVQAQMFGGAWSAFTEREDLDQLPGLAQLAACIADQIGSLQRQLCRPPVTLVHGDFRSSNLLFERSDDGQQLVVIDWQPLTIAKGAYDLGYFLSQSLPTDQRRALERWIITEYHSVLVRGGVRDYTIDELWQDYRLSVAYTASFAVGTSLIDLANDTGRRFARQSLRRADAAVTDLEVVDLVVRRRGG